MRRIVLESFKLLFAGSLLFALFILGSQFFGRPDLKAKAGMLTPAWLVSDDSLDRWVRTAVVRERLHQKGWKSTVEGVVSRGFPGQRLASWSEQILLGRISLGRWMDSSPWIFPEIELMPLNGVEGAFENFFFISVDPQAPDPSRVLFHELGHLYLLFSLLPGLPVDCPRWFNEGLAEEVSDKLASNSVSRWDFQAIPRNMVVPFQELSSSFGKSGSFTEFQAQHAFRLFLDRFGWGGVRRVTRGLSGGRPFRSVFLMEFGFPPERFSETVARDFSKTRILENLPPQEFSKRLQMMAAFLSPPEILPLLSILPDSALSPEDRAKIEKRVRVAETRRCLARGLPEEALGWLGKAAQGGGVDPETRFLVGECKRMLFEKGRETSQQLDSRPERSGWLGVLIVLISGLLAVRAYRWFRARMFPPLALAWEIRDRSNLVFRFLVLILVLLGGGWFFRFIIIGAGPYIGFPVDDDHSRIILAENLVVLLWTALFFFFSAEGPTRSRWLPEASVSGAPPLRTDGVSVSGAPPLRTDGVSVSGAPTLLTGATPRYSFSMALMVLSGFCGSLAFVSPALGGWQPSGLPLGERLISFMVFLAISGAFGLAFWKTVQSWMNQVTSPDKWFPALGYGLFRAGLSASFPETLFTVAFGRVLSGYLNLGGSWVGVMVADVLFAAPHFLLVTNGFPSQDPLGGAFWGPRLGWWAWGIPLLGAFFLLWKGGMFAPPSSDIIVREDSGKDG